MNNTVTISKETLQKLLDNFYKTCEFCVELDIYEFDGLGEEMQEMKEWVNKTFGREIKKDNYE
jgi:hypothetical protein